MAPLHFHSFAKTQKDYTGPDSVVDVCLHAMEEGKLRVTVKQSVYYLWEYFTLTTDQWGRLCALLQRQRLPPSFLWKSAYVRYTKRTGSKDVDLISHCPDAVAALSQIEFLWQDLDAVNAWVHSMRRGCDVEWVAAEVGRRRQWSIGLRRAWLLVAVVGLE